MLSDLEAKQAAALSEAVKTRLGEVIREVTELVSDDDIELALMLRACIAFNCMQVSIAAVAKTIQEETGCSDALKQELISSLREQSRITITKFPREWAKSKGLYVEDATEIEKEDRHN